jgi:hypothetical protein
VKKEPDYWGKFWDRVKEESGYTAYTNSTGYLLGQAITKSIGDFFSRMSEAERQERQEAALRHALSDTETTEELVNTPPAKAGGFGLRLKAGSAGRSGRLYNSEVVIRLRRLLVLDVLLPHIVCDVPAGAYPIPSRPQMLPPIAFS